MTKFIINIEETLFRSIEIEAENDEQAIELAKEQYNNSQVILDSNDITSMQMQAIELDSNGEEIMSTEWIEM